MHPKLQGAEAVFMVISRSISKIPKFENPKHRKDQRISLKKGSRETALTSSSRDDVWCIRSSRARRLCLWWSRGRFPKFQNSKIAKFQNSKITKLENHKNRKSQKSKITKVENSQIQKFRNPKIRQIENPHSTVWPTAPQSKARRSARSD